MEQSSRKYYFAHIEDILQHATWPDKKKVDELLHMDCRMYADLGTDSIRSEKEEVISRSRKIYEAIQKIDYALGTSFLSLMDKK
jgi:hypothetical protein